MQYPVELMIVERTAFDAVAVGAAPVTASDIKLKNHPTISHLGAEHGALAEEERRDVTEVNIPHDLA